MPTNRRYRRRDRRRFTDTHVSLLRHGWYFGWWGLRWEAQDFCLSGVSVKDPHCLNVPAMIEAWKNNPDLRAAVYEQCEKPWIEEALCQQTGTTGPSSGGSRSTS